MHEVWSNSFWFAKKNKRKNYIILTHKFIVWTQLSLQFSCATYLAKQICIYLCHAYRLFGCINTQHTHTHTLTQQHLYHSHYYPFYVVLMGHFEIKRNSLFERIKLKQCHIECVYVFSHWIFFKSINSVNFLVLFSIYSSV